MSLMGYVQRSGKRLAATLVGLIIFFFLASIVGHLRQDRLLAQHPPIGQVVDVGGYRLHLHCQGSGTPTVVVEAGLGGPGLSWAHIQEAVAATTRICVYDRAGLGWSDPGPTPRTADLMAEELHLLLTNAAVSPPFVLVGYSSGGVTARLYAYDHPESVAGMVLVDAAHGEQIERLSADTRLASIVPRLSGILPLLARSGLPGLVPSLMPLPGKEQLPASAYRSYQALMAADPDFATAVHQELLDALDNLAFIRSADRPGALGEIPLVVLAHSQVTEAAAVAQLPASQQEMEQARYDLQAELAALSANGRLEIVYRSGHDVPYKRPDAIVAAIEAVVAAARQQNTALAIRQ